MKRIMLALVIAVTAGVSLPLAGAEPVPVAHRGLFKHAPENTLPAFEYAIEQGADYLELDLGVTKDNVLVVSHDPVLSDKICTGGTGTRVIREMTLAELRKWDCGALKNAAFPRQKTVPGSRIPTLEEVLALAPRGTFRFNIELKISPAAPQYTPSPEEFARMTVPWLLQTSTANPEKRAALQQDELF